MPGSVYIETTIPSAHVTRRTDPSSLHRKVITQDWWTSQLPLYDCWTADAVELELQEGDWPGQSDALQLIAALRRLDVTEETIAIAQRYVDEVLVPADIRGDAIHLAIACLNEMDFLLTWNIRHLANPNKLDHLTVINRRLGLLTPQIVTPEALWWEESP
jgi:hypothetical protein